MPQIKPSSLNTALELIDGGNYVFPVRADKSPACAQGFKAAVNTPEEAEELWRGTGAPLLGIDCGRSDFWVLDIDPDGLGWLDENRDIIPETQCYKTPRGGFHYVFAGHPTIRNSSNKITKGVDVRGIGGYVCRGNGYDIYLDADIAEASPELIRLALEANSETASSQAPAPAAPVTLNILGKLTDGREAKMTEMVYAKCVDAVREVDFDEAYDRVVSKYPDYERLVAPRGASLEADGRGLSEWKKKTKSTLAKFEREGLLTPISQTLKRGSGLYAFNQTNNTVIEVATGDEMTKDAFRTVTGRTANQDVSAGEMPVVKGTVFYPNEKIDGRIITMNGRPLFNTYPKSEVPKADPHWEASTSVSIVKNHVRKLFGDNEKIVLQFLAHMVQKRGQKINWVLLFVGPEGDGKSTIADNLMRSVLGFSHVRTIKTQDVQSDFNSWAVGAELGVFEELKDRQGKIVESLKPNITNSVVSITCKGKDPLEHPNLQNYIACTNHFDALSLAQGDRRFAVVATTTKSPADLASPEEFEALHNAIQTSPEALRGWLENIDLTGFNPNRPPPTSVAKQQMVEANLSDVQTGVRQVLMNPELGLRDECFVYNIMTEKLREVGLTRGLHKGFASEMQKIGFVRFDEKGTRFNGKCHQIYVREHILDEGIVENELVELLKHPNLPLTKEEF